MRLNLSRKWPELKIELPSAFPFTTKIPVRITDLNYGNHVGNDALLSIIHECRMQFLAHHGYTELDCGGTGLIMSDVAIEFKKELFYGDVVEAQIATTDFTSFGFDVCYLLQKRYGEQLLTVAKAKTGMLCYNYEQQRLEKVPAAVREKLETTG
jgi:acyl-CoA thioester hydrolase